MSTARALDIRALIDEHPITPYQWMVVTFSFCVLVLVGFELAIFGFIMPELKRLWQVTNQSLGPVLSAAMAGLTVGAMFAGPLADKFGRRLILVITVFVIGVCTLMCALSGDATHMFIYRLITGFGLGGAMPSAATLVSEFSPEKHRSLIVTVVFSGFTLGAAGGGFLSALLIPHFGWNSVLFFGGGTAIVLSLILLLKLPESLRFLTARDAPAATIRAAVKRFAPEVDLQEVATFYCSVAATGIPSAIKSDASPIRLVLSAQYRFGTYMFWVAYFMGCFLVYLMGGWMPTLIKESGYTVSYAAVVAAVFQVGGPAGSIFMGWCMDRLNPHKVLAFTYLLGGIFLLGLSMVAHQFILLLIFSFLIGFCFNGANTGQTALSTSFYPTAARATGACWMHGIGHVGAIISAFAGAEMLGMGLGFTRTFNMLTLPALLATLSLLALGRHNQRQILIVPA